MTFLFQGILLGLSISMLLGPMIFLYLDATIEKGMRGGVAVGLGVWSSDVAYIIASFFGLTYFLQFVQSEGFKFGLGSVGSIVLIGIGLWTYLSAKPQLQKARKNKNDLPKSDFGLWLKGFLVNSLNPFCGIIWIGAVSSMMTNNQISALEIGLFSLGGVGTIVLTDLLKIRLSERLLLIVSARNQVLLKKIAGVGIVLLGFALMVRVF